MVGEADQHPFCESSDVQAIIISNSPKMGFHGQSASGTSLLADLGDVSLPHAEVQEDIPSEQTAGRSDKAAST